MPNSTEVNWDPSIWKDINDAVVAEVGKVRVAQKVFPTSVFDNDPTEVPNDVIDFKTLTIQEGRTKPFVEIFQEFSLTSTQVTKEAQINTAKTLARMAAKAIALAEDTVLFQGGDGNLPGSVQTSPQPIDGHGVLGEADPKDASDADSTKVSLKIPVQQTGRPGILYGEHLFTAVAEGIVKLTANKSQAPKYALILPVNAYADTFVPPGNESLVTTAERIRPLVEGGFYGTGTLPESKGLLIALGGDPTTLYVGREASTEYLRKDGSKYFFRVVERIQFVARDPRAFVLLDLRPAHKAKP